MNLKSHVTLIIQDTSYVERVVGKLVYQILINKSTKNYYENILVIFETFFRRNRFHS
jgi:hypothetical protein